MKNIKNYLYILFAITILSSCTKNLEELNIDPNNPDPNSVDISLLLTAGEENILSQFGYNWDRYAGTFTQQFAGNHATGVNADQYLLRATDFEFSFLSPYRGGFKDLRLVIDNGAAQNLFQHVGIAKIITAVGLGAITDVYGDIPWSEAFDVTNIYPKYDSQEEIYATIIDLLTTSISDLDNPNSVRTVGSQEFVYQGDVTKWKATAYALIARYENHLSKKDPLGSATKALAAVDKALANGFSNANQFAYPYNGSDGYRNPWYVLYENNLIIASDNFMGMLITGSGTRPDPRLFAYWNDTAFGGGNVGFSGKLNGEPTSNTSYSPVGPQGYYGKVDSPELIMTFMELKFIEAEAALRAGMNARAALANNAAIAASYALLRDAGASHINEYYAITFGDLIFDAWANSSITAFGSETAGSINIERIMTEKYKSMFTMNIEIWNDLRRHDYQYPSYLALPANSNLSDFIRRGLYPQNELNLNPNTPRGVTMADKLWWDQ